GGRLSHGASSAVSAEARACRGSVAIARGGRANTRHITLGERGASGGRSSIRRYDRNRIRRRGARGGAIPPCGGARGGVGKASWHSQLSAGRWARGGGAVCRGARATHRAVLPVRVARVG